MSSIKKTRAIHLLIGFALIVAAFLVVFISTRTTHYTATITAVTDTYTTSRRSGSGTGRTTRYNEIVDVTYEDLDGNQLQATGIRVKRSSKLLPEVGDTIQITSGRTPREYQSTTTAGVSIALFFAGVLWIITSLRVTRRMQLQLQQNSGPEIPD